MKINGFKISDTTAEHLRAMFSDDYHAATQRIFDVFGLNGKISTLPSGVEKLISGDRIGFLETSWGYRSQPVSEAHKAGGPIRSMEYMEFLARKISDVLETYASEVVERGQALSPFVNSALVSARGNASGAVRGFAEGFTLFDPDEDEIRIELQLEDSAFRQIADSLDSFGELIETIAREAQEAGFEGSVEVLVQFASSARNTLDSRYVSVLPEQLLADFAGLKPRDRVAANFVDRAD